MQEKNVHRLKKHLFEAKYLDNWKKSIIFAPDLEKSADPPVLADASSPFSSFVVTVTLAEPPSNHPVITPKSPRNHPLLKAKKEGNERTDIRKNGGEGGRGGQYYCPETTKDIKPHGRRRNCQGYKATWQTAQLPRRNKNN